ncbi:MAG: hypothetical protein AB7S26_27870 [Sandaracinaceae bacterium]
MRRAQRAASGHDVAYALAQLAAARGVGALDDDEAQRLKAEVLAPPLPVADVRAFGHARRGRTLAIAFDGALAVPREDDTDPTLVRASPRPGAIDFVERAAERFDIAIVSGRAHRPLGTEAMRRWLTHHGVSSHAMRRVRFVRSKPPADVYLAARALRFEGRFPPLDAILDAQARPAAGVEPVAPVKIGPRPARHDG